jgi:hypothetical protein
MKYPFRFPRRSLHWGLFRVPNDGIISANSLGSDVLARKYPRGTAGCAASIAPKNFARALTLILVAGLALHGCHSKKTSAGPSIEFTRVPQAAEGSPDKLDIIEGRVTGVRPELQIVLYARSEKWWVQPLANEPFTKLRPDSTWTNSTHLGTEYAALLVETGFRPATTLDALPTRGGSVAAVAIVKGSEPASKISKTLQFSGYEWRIRNAPSNRGGGNNYDPSNAWTDSDGALHLRIAKVAGEWTCAEVSLTRSFGYGTYSFVVRDTSRLEAPAVFSIFTWDYAGTDQNNREMDIEVSRWGDPTSKNAQYVVKPFYVPENVSRFTLPSGRLTHSLRWEPGRVSFRTVRGSESINQARPVAEHLFTSGVPSPGVETVRMNLYIFRPTNVPLQNETEVVIEKFEYFP